jgi:hypothetical protein
MKAKNHAMLYSNPAAHRRRLIPLAAVLLATTLGGCIGYAGNPSRDYSYGDYSGKPGAYAYSHNYRPYYSSGYSRY